jgi:hypothetical protein
MSTRVYGRSDTQRYITLDSSKLQTNIVIDTQGFTGIPGSLSNIRSLAKYIMNDG